MASRGLVRLHGRAQQRVHARLTAGALGAEPLDNVGGAIREFELKSGVIASQGECSEQTDIVIDDRQYSQFLCNQANNRVVSSTPLDEVRFAQVRTAFAKAFPQRAAATLVIPPCNKPDH